MLLHGLIYVYIFTVYLDLYSDINFNNVVIVCVIYKLHTLLTFFQLTYFIWETGR